MFHIKNNYYNYKGRENFEGLKAETKNSLGFFCCFFCVFGYGAATVEEKETS